MMSELRVAALLRAAADDIDVQAAPTDSIVRQGRRRNRWRRLASGAGVAGVAAAALVIALLIVEPGSRPAIDPGNQDAGGASPGCAVILAPEVLPEWARTGFSEPEPRAIFVRSSRGDMIAILFGGQLYSPPHQTISNKVLWVSRVPAEPGPLQIDARLEGSTRTDRQAISGGPGPSTVDLPEPGCWRLDLKWGERTDTIYLRYVAP
jgi:hypothetical protein